MTSFKLKKINQVVFAVTLDDEFHKFIKLSDLPQLMTDINEFLTSIHHPLPNFDQSDSILEIDLDLTAKERKKLMRLILVGKNKVAIKLPDKISKSKEHSYPLYYSHQNYSYFRNYWHAKDPEIKYQLYQKLSEDILEIPYADDPNDFECRCDQVAFHPNHGTGHAIRLTVLFQYYLKLVNPILDDAIQEEACLELALFLFRSGRTNELSWSDDNSYNARSAAIFTQIAVKLGYARDLVYAIAACFDYKNQNPSPNPGYKIKCTLFQNLFALSHNSDLVRCNSSYKTISENLTTILIKLIADKSGDAIDTIVYNALIFAAKCCKLTGASVTIATLHKGSETSYRGNPYVAVNTVAHVRDAFMRLNTIGKSVSEDSDSTPEDEPAQGQFQL